MKHNVKFGTGGFRAIIGEDFNRYNVELICQAVSNIIIKKNLKKRIVVGFDNRFGSEYFAKWCAGVFAGNNIEVMFNKLSVTTPVVVYASQKEHNDFGMMITASHNPYDYNGVKVFINGRDASIEDTNAIEQEMTNLEVVNKKDFNEEIDKHIFLTNYDLDFINTLVDNQQFASKGKGLNVVFDAMLGSSVRELKYLCTKMGIQKFEILNSKHNAFFDYVAPAPTKDNLSKLRARVKELHADLGFALDADGDRLAVIDSEGNYIDNNTILAVCYYYLVKYSGKTGPSVKNCCTTNLLDEVTKHFGYPCYEVDVGFKNISSKLLETGAVIGGESSGGLAVDNHILAKDSMISIGLIIKMVADLGKSFSEIVNEVKEFAGNYESVFLEKSYHFRAEEKTIIKEHLVSKLASQFNNENIEKFDTASNIKLYFADNEWLCVRFSGTEPLIRLFIEAKEKDMAYTLSKKVENFLSKYLIK